MPVDYYEEACANFAELFSSMERAQLEEVTLRLSADAQRLREELDKQKAIIR